MKQFGVKLWSKDFIKNPEFALQSVQAVKEGLFDYIELFVLANTYTDTHHLALDAMKGLKVIIHAPHATFGMDTGDKNRFEQNCADLRSSQEFADLFKSEIIILHAGCHEGEEYLEETIHQFKNINDQRLTIENLPQICSATRRMLHGSSPAQIKHIIEECKCKFCLDFSHAICAANYAHRDIENDLQAYCQLNPTMYHLCDGDYHGYLDEHRHYGEGNYPLVKILNNYISDNAFITMETGHGIPENINPWIEDINYIHRLAQNESHK